MKLFLTIVRFFRTHISCNYSPLIFDLTYYCLYLIAKRIVKLVQLLGLLLLLLLLVWFISAFLSQWSRMTILSESLSRSLLMNLQGHALLQLRLFLRHLHLHLHHLRLPCGNVPWHSCDLSRYQLLSKTWLVEILRKPCEILIDTICPTVILILILLQPGLTKYMGAC